MSAAANLCQAATYYVDGASSSASDSNPGTTTAPMKTVSAAVTKRGGAGNTILVRPAVYRETVTLTASGSSGNPFTIRALGSPVVVDGADDYSSLSSWTLVAGNVWLAASVTWNPQQVFADGARLAASTAAVASLPAKSFEWVSGAGLYVNVGGGNPGAHQAAVGRRAYGFDLSGRAWIVIDGFKVTRTEERSIYLSGSSNNVTVVRNTVTFANKYGIYATTCTGAAIDSNVVSDNLSHGIYFNSGVTASRVRGNETFRNEKPGHTPANGIYVNGSTGNRIEGNRVHENVGNGVVFYGSANGNVSIQNRSWGNGGHGFQVSASTGAQFVGDVAWGNHSRGFSIEGASTGASLSDCIATDNGLTASEFDLSVDAGAVTGFVSDYNIFWNSTTAPAVRFSGTSYATLAAYVATSGRDVHSTAANPKFVDPAHADFHLQAKSPAIDAANSAVANWPALDAEGHARLDDPASPNLGTGPVPYGDRGALELVKPQLPPVAVLKATPATGSTPLAVTLDANGSSDPEGGALSYRFAFGDGSSAGPQSQPTAAHSYGLGTWTASVIVTDPTSLADTAFATVTVLPPNHPPTAAINLKVRAPGVITRPDTVFTIPLAKRPNYLSKVTEPTFGGQFRRIAGDEGAAFNMSSGGKGVWGAVSRHHYSKDQPWSSDGALVALDNNGGFPDNVLLDGTTFKPVSGRCSNYTLGDDRWHPSPLHPQERINAKGDELMWFDVVNCVKTRTWTLPFVIDGFGRGEGNPSADGRFVALCDSARVFVVDMDPQPPLTAYPSQRIGPALDVSNCGLTDGCVIGWASISASGKYVVVKYVNDHPRVFDVNPATLALKPRPMPATETLCSSGSPAQGYVYDLGHPDLALNPYDGDEDVMIGQEHCDLRGQTIGGQLIGGVVMVRLKDGAITSLTDPTNEAHPHHVSARNDHRPGWVYVDYYREPDTRFSDEIVAVKMDGSKTVERFAHKHTDATGCFLCESHAVPARDGRRVIWASNWTTDCTVCGTPGDIRDYVVDATSAFVPDTTALQMVTVSGAGSTDSDGTIASYLYRLGDGYSVGPVASSSVGHFYAPGTFTPWVMVTDNRGAADSVKTTLTVPPGNRTPNGTILGPASDVTIPVGASLSLSASASDPDGNTPLKYLWDLGGAGASYFSKSPGTVVFSRVGTFFVTFLVTDALGLDDPTPDSVLVTVTPVGGRAPVVTAPAAVAANEIVPITVTVTAADPDGDAITNLTANLSGLPAGNNAKFTVDSSHTTGTLTWTPSSTAGRAAPYVLTFTATNSLSASAATAITVADVVGPSLIANPSFESGTTGWGGAGSATVARVAGGKDGAWAAQVTGPAAIATFGLNDSPNWVASTIAGGIRYRFSGWVRSATGAAAARLRVREYSAGTQVGPSVSSPSVSLTTTWQRLSLDIVTSLGGSTLDLQVLDDPVAAGEVFLVDSLKAVIVPPVGGEAGAPELASAGSHQEGEGLDAVASRKPLAAIITPSPVVGEGILDFVTTRRGRLDVRLYDLSGRLVRVLASESDAPSGIHRMKLGGRSGDGARLAAGVYYYRISAIEGSSHGRVVVLN